MRCDLTAGGSMYLAGKILLTIYLYCISYFYTLSVPWSWTSLLRIAGIYAAVHFLCKKLTNIKITITTGRGAVNWKFGSCVFAGTLVVMLLYYAGYYPGGLNPDTFNQWYQVEKGFLLDWHPAIHTLLFLKLPSLIWNNLGSASLMQIIWLSLAMAYLGIVMERWEIKKGWICAALTLGILNPASAITLSFVWKDTALTIFAVVLAGQIMEIVFSDGEWLKQWKHSLVFGLFGALAMLMRHNAILLVAPMMFLVIIIYWQKVKYACILSGIWMMFFVVGIKGPLYHILGVQSHPQVAAEMLGVPMTILANVLVHEPDSLDEDAREFLYRIGDQELWENTYQEGSWNSAKWMGADISNDVIEEVGAANVLGYTWHAVQKEPYYAYRAVVKLFEVVWKPLGSNVTWSYYINIRSNSYGYETKGISWLQKVLDLFRQISVDGICFTTWGWHIGFFTILLLFAGISRLKGGLAQCIYWVPMLCYNFGTAFVLCGPDFRFFSFNTVVTFPVLLAIFSEKKKVSEDETVG